MNTLTNTDLFIDNKCLGDQMILVEVTPYYEYVNNVRTDTRLGYKYTVVLASHNYEKLDVKIPGDKLLEVQAGNGMPVSFTGLQVRPYVNFKGKVAQQFTASAKGITPKR